MTIQPGFMTLSALSPSRGAARADKGEKHSIMQLTAVVSWKNFGYHRILDTPTFGLAQTIIRYVNSEASHHQVVLGDVLQTKRLVINTHWAHSQPDARV